MPSSIEVQHNSTSVKRTCKKIYNILEKSRVTTGPCNLISMKPPGKYNVNPSTLEEVWNLYSTVHDKVSLSLAEIPKDISYFKIDIDLESKKEPKKRLYKQKDILSVIDIIRESADKFLELDKTDKSVFVMEKEDYNKKDDIYRDGFHLAFPYIVQSAKIRNAIFDNTCMEIEKKKLFKELKLSMNKIMDRNASVGKTPWLLMGSSKPDSNPYNVSMILNYKNKKVKSMDDKEKLELLSLLNPDLTIDNSSKLKSDIPLASIEKKYDQVSSKLNNMMSLPSINKDTETAKVLIKMLSKDRAESYDSWIKVGYCLYNIDKTLINEWIEFSKQSSTKFKKGECEKLWKRMKTGQDLLTIRSLHLWAREDNYLEYSTFKSKEYNVLFKQSMTGDHQNIAKAIYCKYQTEFVCASISHNSWYQYDYGAHRWKKVEAGYSLTNKITEEFVNEYLNMNTMLYQKAMEAEPAQKMEIMKEVEKIQLLINRLNNESFLSTLMRALARRFYVDKFSEQLDENYDIIGFNNGVYDLKEKRFRDGRPEDYLTMTTGIDYQELDTDSEEYKSVIQLMEDIHPEKEQREYVYTLMSTWVAGHHKEETLHLFNGSGSNGKSVTFELCKYAFGDYFMSVPITLLTRKRGATENASPVLAQLKGKRLGVLQEPEEGEKMSVGLMKELTGNDEISARPMYEAPIRFKPQIKFAIPCNILPEIPARDEGTWRRLRVIDHVMKFVKNPKGKNQKKIDKSLKEKLEDFAPQLMSFLINRYLTVYCEMKDGIDVPDAVLYATNMYNQDNNCLKQFLSDKFEQTGKKEDKISEATMWNEFKLYFKEEFEGNKRPTKKELLEYCDKTFGKKKKQKGFTGYVGVVFNAGDEAEEEMDI